MGNLGPLKTVKHFSKVSTSLLQLPDLHCVAGGNRVETEERLQPFETVQVFL
jgi:hypothetical protein